MRGRTQRKGTTAMSWQTLLVTARRRMEAHVGRPKQSQGRSMPVGCGRCFFDLGDLDALAGSAAGVVLLFQTRKV